REEDRQRQHDHDEAHEREPLLSEPGRIGNDLTDDAEHRQARDLAQHSHLAENRPNLAQQVANSAAGAEAEDENGREQHEPARGDRLDARERRVDDATIGLLRTRGLARGRLRLAAAHERLILVVNHIVVSVQPRELRLDLRHLVDSGTKLSDALPTRLDVRAQAGDLELRLVQSNLQRLIYGAFLERGRAGPGDARETLKLLGALRLEPLDRRLQSDDVGMLVPVAQQQSIELRLQL